MNQNIKYTNKSREQLEAEGYCLIHRESFEIKRDCSSDNNHDMEYSQTLGVVGGKCRKCGYKTI